MSVLGRDAVGAATDNNGTGILVVGADPNSVPYKVPIGSTSDYMVARLNHATAGSQALRLVAYRDNAGTPGALHAVTAEVVVDATVAPAATFVTFPFAATVYFPPGSYWVGTWTGTVVTNNALIDKTTTTNNQRFNVSATYSSTLPPPDPFPTPSTGGGEYTCYAVLNDRLFVRPRRMPMGV